MNSSLTFDVRTTPFSTKGAWIDLSPVTGLHQTSEDIHLVSHQTGMHAVLALVPVIDGERANSVWTATPSLLVWDIDSSDDEPKALRRSAEATFEGQSAMRIRGSGLGMRIAEATSALTPFTGTYCFVDPIDGAVVFTSYETGRRYRVTSLRGELTVVGSESLGAHRREVIATGAASPAGTIRTDRDPLTPDAGNGDWEILIEEFESSMSPSTSSRTFDECATNAKESFDQYLGEIAPWRDASTPAAELSAYVMWSATVSPRGFFGREAVLMSKHWMDKVWSWDHCFNALALAPGSPHSALDQFLLPFDHQDATGALPDSIAHSEVLYNFVKPPIHGWAFAKLRARLGAPMETHQLRDVYNALSSWTTFWLEHRRVPGHVVPFYQHGNDSGWDNSTSFDHDRVLESPELGAFLAMQLDVLSGLADELGTLDAARWTHERDQIVVSLIAEFWNGEEFVPRGAITGQLSSTTSLLPHLSIMAARLLPPETNLALAERIAQHLTEFGPATELPSSEEYRSDGYWRGPIWAPSTVLIEDGLRTAGFDALADTVSARFRALCEKSGFAENFDALTGEGLRDRAYTWTASSYLLLAHESIQRRLADGTE